MNPFFVIPCSSGKSEAENRHLGAVQLVVDEVWSASGSAGRTGDQTHSSGIVLPSSDSYGENAHFRFGE